MRLIYILVFSTIIIVSCETHVEQENFNVFLNAPCLLINTELDNSIEGTYFTVTSFSKKSKTIQTQIPITCKEFIENYSNWYIGWGTNKPLFDSGVENLAEIDSINVSANTITIGKIIRGSGFPTLEQRIIFINKNPSGFSNNIKKPIINPQKLWPEFKGQSIHIGGITYDSENKKWIMLANESDTNSISIYGAYSQNLKDWSPANNGKALFTEYDFKNCTWAGKDKSGKHYQCPMISQILYYKNQWHIFMYGYDNKGNRNIGLVVRKDICNGKYSITPHALISSGQYTWNSKACYSPKISKYKTGFVMIYNGVNEENEEQIGLAFSEDLQHWKNSKYNPIISNHDGWRSSPFTSEPACVFTRNDTIFMLISGAKKFKMGFWHHYITGNMYKDISGNVDDAQLGMYYTVTQGKKCIAHSNNPIFINDYGNPYENEHLGSNFFIFQTDTSQIILYQAKTSYCDTKYSLFMRTKPNK